MVSSERDNTVSVIAAVGTSKSGKTTTLEYLISRLSAEGYRIGAIKHIHRENFTIDREGTNTWRYAKAGSKVIVAVSPQEIAILKRTEAALDDLDQVIELLKREHLEIIFIEGFHSKIAKRLDIPKIVTAVDESNLRSTLEGTVEPILAVTGVISQGKSVISWLKVPILSLETDGEQLLRFVKNYVREQEEKDST